jgi:thioredoxin reductase (NADPH)
MAVVSMSGASVGEMDSLDAGDGLVVFSLCAAWCDTCRVFRATYERVAADLVGHRFVWLDIEDDSELCGDVDVETFPTLAVFRGETLVHFGPSLPQREPVARLIAALAEGGRAFETDNPVTELRERVAARLAEAGKR